jgi:hypothetical protein
MSLARCSEPDITFDEDGNLDEESARIISDALQKEIAIKGTCGCFMIRIWSSTNFTGMLYFII